MSLSEENPRRLALRGEKPQEGTQTRERGVGGRGKEGSARESAGLEPKWHTHFGIELGDYFQTVSQPLE